MSFRYHVELDRILLRRAAETEALRKQAEAARPWPKAAAGLFCFGIAGAFGVLLPTLFPLWLLPGLGGVLMFRGALGVTGQVRRARRALAEEQEEESYRRYLLGRLGGPKFDRLAGAIAVGGSEESLRGWLRSLELDEHDIEYLLWMTEAFLQEIGGFRREPKKRPPPAAVPGRPEITRSVASPAATEPVPEPPPVDLSAARESAPMGKDPREHLQRLSLEEIDAFRKLAGQRRSEYEAWERAGGGRAGPPDDPLGKLEGFSPQKLAELKRRARERRSRGEAPKSDQAAPAAQGDGEFTERELAELERQALSRFEPRPGGGQVSAPEETLAAVFDPQQLARLREKAEGEARAKSLPAAEDDDPAWSDDHAG